MSSVVPYTGNLEQPTKSQAFGVPFASAPEIYGENTFLLDKNPNILSLAENLASDVKYLVKILKTTLPSSDIHNKFQIELRKMNPHDDQCSTYRMSLRTDSVLWFKHHALNDSNVDSLEQLYNIGSQYVERVKSETKHYPNILNEHEVERIPISSSASKWCHTDQRGEKCERNEQNSCSFEHYQWCFDENQGLTGECATISASAAHYKKFRHTSRIDKDDKPAYQCRHLSTKLNRTQAFCLFRVDPNFWIYENKVIKPSCYPYFIVAARSDATPVVTLNPVKHCRNEDYIQSCDAWQAVLQTLIYMKDQIKLDKLPLHSIYVNFGKWMTQKADDAMCRECHAHINIILTRETIEKINDINPSKVKQHKGRKLFQSLVGSIIPPKTHRLDDATKLIEYMNDHMTPLLIKQNRGLVRSISTLKEELESLKLENENLRKLMFGPTQAGQETDDSACGIDANDDTVGTQPDS